MSSKLANGSAQRSGKPPAGRPHDARLHDVVLGAVGRTPRKVALQAGVLAVVLHAGGVALAVGLGGAHEPPPKRESKPLVVFEHVVELEPEPPPPAAAEPPPPEPVAPPPRVKAPREKIKAPEPPVPQAAPEPPPEAPPPPAPPPEAPPSEPPPAAQAAQVVAAAAGSQGAAFNIATGSGQAYAGGTTSARGTGTQANHTGQVGTGNGTGLTRARSAQLRTRNPPCGWPPEAEDSDLEEAFVTVRATIQADGSASAVEVLSDPGYGFGKRMQWCIRSRMKFEPALDAAGNPVAGQTAPFRVRFVREE